MPKHGFGATLTWNGTTVGKLTSISGFSASADTADATTHDSSGGWEEVALGVMRSGEMTVEGLFDHTDAGQAAMWTDFAAKTMREAVFGAPDSVGTLTATCAVTGITPMGAAGSDGMIPFSATLKISGEPSFATTAVTGMSAIGFSNDVLMMPTFAIGTYDYAVTITHGETSTVITPVDATSGEVITITAPNGTTQTVATGVASSAIAISSSALNTITVKITKSGYVSKTYTFKCVVLAA